MEVNFSYCNKPKSPRKVTLVLKFLESPKLTVSLLKLLNDSACITLIIIMLVLWFSFSSDEERQNDPDVDLVCL